MIENLRLEVAKALGWVDEGHAYEWTSPNGYDRHIWDIPDYPNDEKACFWDLVPNMSDVDICRRTLADGKWVWWVLTNNSKDRNAAPTLAEAICKAFLKNQEAGK